MCLLGRVERALGTTRTRRASIRRLTTSTSQSLSAQTRLCIPLRAPTRPPTYLSLRWGRRRSLLRLPQLDPAHLPRQPVHVHPRRRPAERLGLLELGRCALGERVGRQAGVEGRTRAGGGALLVAAWAGGRGALAGVAAVRGLLAGLHRVTWIGHERWRRGVTVECTCGRWFEWPRPRVARPLSSELTRWVCPSHARLTAIGPLRGALRCLTAGPSSVWS